MGDPHLVVDGSNIATEGRSLPSLQQLLESVDAIKKEFSYDNVTVIVDATFGHRIDSSERDRYDEATSNGEIITPPAGVIGRGDAFILEVADRADAVVLSNDSFQEFHGKYTWLFDEGRLLGGKHVPGVGWIFLARSPVRGPTSRKAVSDAKRKRRGSKQAASTAPAKSSRGRSSKAAAKSSKTPAKKKASTRASGERKSAGKEPEPYNEPLPFIEFVGAHPVGSVVEGEVEQFSSHGAYVMADGTRCYVSLKSIADPAPRSAREVLNLGETREWVVQAIDTPRRGIDLAVPGMERTGDDDDGSDQGEPTETPDAGAESRRPRRRRRSTEDDVPAPEQAEAPEPTAEEPASPARTASATRAEEADASEGKKLSVSQRRKLRAQQAAAREAETEQATQPARETMAKKAAAKKTATKKSTAKKSSAKRAAAKKSTAKKSTAKKAPARKSTAKKSSAKKSSAKKSTAKKSTAKKSTAKKAPAKKSTAKKSTAKKAPTKRKASAKKAPAKRKASAKKAPAKRKASARKAPAKKRSS